VVVGRKAADPGIVEQIAGFLGDNGYTRAWNDAVQGGLRPMDRMLASDEELAAHLTPTLRKTEADPAELQRHLDVLQADGRGAQTYKEAVMDWIVNRGDEETDMEQKLTNAIGLGYLKEKVGRKGMLAYDAAHGPAYMASKPGLVASTALANPYAAYGLPAAGVGLAAWGIHDVLAAQQQAQKDSQLPLQGGVA
jgi:hypothetical protein